MSRTTEAAGAGPPDVADLTPEQRERAFLLFFYDKARKQRVLVQRAKAALDEQAAELTTIFREAKADANLTRKELTAYLDDGDLTSRTLSAAEERRLRHKQWLGQPVGFQPDLFEDQRPQEVKDEAWARGVGYATGLRGEACELPEGMEPRFAQAFSAGWGKGQDELAWALSAVGKIVDRAPDASAKPVDLEPEPSEAAETSSALEPEVIDAKAKELKRAGFTKRTAPPAEPEQAAA